MRKWIEPLLEGRGDLDGMIFGAVLSILLFFAAIAAFLSSRAAGKKQKEKLEDQFGREPDDDDLEFDSIARPWKYCTDKTPAMTVDDITWNDLDMNKVFARINACQTSLGEEHLYTILHKPEPETAARREELIQALDREPDLRLQLQLDLNKVGKCNHNGLIEFICSAEVFRLKHGWIYHILAWLPAAFLLVLPLNLQWAVTGSLCAACVNILCGCFAKRKIERQFSSVQYFSAVLWCCRKICKIKNENLSSVQKSMKSSLKRLRGLSGAISCSIQNRYAMSDIDMLAEYTRMVFLSEIRNYNKLIRIITANREVCRSLCDELARLDASISILSFRNSLPFYSRPHFIPNMQLNLQDVYHPLLRHAVLNSVLLTNDSLITGSNASGKSTFIKAAAVNGILAMALNTCTARVYQGPRAAVMTSMAVRDDILAGESYFVAEIKSLKRVLDHAKTGPCLCFIDEILKGTNTVERIAASAAVLRRLHGQNCLCAAATHDIELTQILKGEYLNYHFSEKITNREIIFDYLIKPGPSTTKNAVKLLSYTGYEAEIIRDAEALAEQYEKTGRWTAG
jgi:DNA mismatch repair ATPase MutS